MSNAALFVEAVDTLTALIRAAFGWLIFFAVTGSILALAAIACGAWAVDTAWGWLWGRVRAADGVDAPSEPEQPPRPPDGRTGRRTPTWAHTQPLDHEWDEAA